MKIGPTNENPLDRLLFEPESSWPLAIMRILLGTAILGWSISMMFDISTLLSDGGLVSSAFADTRWRAFGLTSDSGVWIALASLAAAAVMVIVGLRPSFFLFVSFLLLASIQRRSPLLLNSGDLILRNLALLLALTPSGAALSIDRWRKHGRASLWSAPQIAPWGLRLIQLQMVLVYFIAFWTKQGALWSQGTAVSTALRIEDIQRVGLPESIVTNVPLMALFTWGTLAVELALAAFLWNKRFRPGLIVLAIGLHLSIDVLMLVGFFGVTMISGLMSFLDGDAIDRQIAKRRPRRPVGVEVKVEREVPESAPTSPPEPVGVATRLKVDA